MKPKLTLIRGGRYNEPRPRFKSLRDVLPPATEKPTVPKRELPPQPSLYDCYPEGRKR